MNAKLSEYLSFRDVPFALVCGVIWFVVLWVAGYPANERAGVAVIAYLAQWASRFILNGLTMFLLERLNKRAAETIERLGIEIPQEIPQRIKTIARVFAVLGVTFTFLAMTGLALSATFPTVAAVGLTPLSDGFGIAGWGMLAAGVVGLTALFGVMFVLFTRTEAVAGNIRWIAAGVNRPLKALNFALNPNAVITND